MGTPSLWLVECALLVFRAGDNGFDQVKELVLAFGKAFSEDLDALFGGSGITREPTPHLARDAACECAALDGLIGEVAGAFFDVVFHQFVGKDIRLEITAILFFVGMIGAGEIVLAAKVVVVSGFCTLFKKLWIFFAIKGGESTFKEAAPVGCSGFEGLVAVLAATAFHQVGFFVTGVLPGRKAVGRGLEVFAKEGLVKAVGAASVGGEF